MLRPLPFTRVCVRHSIPGIFEELSPVCPRTLFLFPCGGGLLMSGMWRCAVSSGPIKWRQAVVYLQEGVCAWRGCTSLVGHRGGGGAGPRREAAAHVSQRGQRAAVVLGEAAGTEGLAARFLLPAVRPPSKHSWVYVPAFISRFQGRLQGHTAAVVLQRHGVSSTVEETRNVGHAGY